MFAEKYHQGEYPSVVFLLIDLKSVLRYVRKCG